MSEKEMQDFIDSLDTSGSGKSVRDSQSQEERELASLWDELGEIDAPVVSDERLVSDFRDKLKAYEEGLAAGQRSEAEVVVSKKETVSPLVSFFRYVSVAGAAAVLALACFIAWQQSVRTEELERELDRSREALAMALLDEGSAPKRLEGLEAASQVMRPSAALRASMVRTFDADTNVNVRLAAVSALKSLPREEAISILLERMEHESSPLLQMEMLRQVMELVDPSSESAVVKRLNEMPLEPRVKSALKAENERI